MATLRDSPYIWITWISKLLAGTLECEWAAWFKTQHMGGSWQKAPSDFVLTDWLIQHDALVKEERARLEAEGATVRTERQNQFTLEGRAATLSGKPDLVSETAERIVVHDIKTGKPTDADAFQVMLYMWALPLANPRYRENKPEGRVVYTDHAVDIPASAIDDTFHSAVVGLIGRLAAKTPAERVPSTWECGSCEITSADCPDRIQAEKTDVF